MTGLLAGVVFGQLWDHHGGFCLAIYAFSSELLFGGLFLLLAELSHGLFFLLSLLTFWISILTSVQGIPSRCVTPKEMEKRLVLHKGHSPVALLETSRARLITPHTPSPIDLVRSRQCGIAQSRPIIRAQEGCLSQPHKGAAQMGGCLSLPSKGAHYLVCPLFWNASILVLITFLLHSQSTWTIGAQVQTKCMHKTCSSNCTIHGQIFYFFSISFHSLGGSNIGDEGAKSLSGALARMSNLQYLLKVDPHTAIQYPIPSTASSY